MTKADPAAQRHLLSLQEQDRLIAKLGAERRKLPVLATLDDLRETETRLQRDRVAASTAVSDARRDVSFAEGEVQLVRIRRDKQQAVLDSGAIGAKDLGNLQNELTNLAARQSELEENELAAMEALEAREAELAEIETRLATIGDEIAAAEEQAGTEGGEIDKKLAKASADRETIAEKIPAEVIELYEQVRARTGALAVVELHGTVTSPITLDFSLAELDAIRSTAPDEVYVSDEHEYIIVRPS
ncbi:hypothetical protein BSZ39_11600 [Bowdeniella nasicola]|uniref:CT398-like coiled coil hairpin domain-containing protein n=1 Tax=Bowdeniella nasicola TaxID=208480 RepID=A0A1Q5Q0A1_9ACTO|nr:hypothetical protein [Bowdeniella nasicola]OKL53050.1 hypothetical protein BSZ39_11600 [Bowdeniella nasicola]